MTSQDLRLLLSLEPGRALADMASPSRRSRTRSGMPASGAPKQAKVLSKPFHLREIVAEVDRMLAAA